MRLFGILVILCLLNGCASYVERPYALPYTPGEEWIEAAKLADHVVVTKLPGAKQDSPKAASYSYTVTSLEMKRLLDALAALEKPTDSMPGPVRPALVEWQLQCYRGSNILAAARFSRDLFVCGEAPGGYIASDSPWTFESPWVLKRLYRRVTKDSTAGH
jgi:hypothetical protein